LGKRLWGEWVWGVGVRKCGVKGRDRVKERIVKFMMRVYMKGRYWREKPKKEKR
jgi:hypothetical protein